MEGIGSQGLKTKLIINYLPQSMSDNQFRMMFAQIGLVDSWRVMRDKATGYSFGYGFVDFVNPDHADMAIEKLNGHKIENKTLRVAYSKPAGSDKNVNLYVSGLGQHLDETKLMEIFSMHGDVVNTKILREVDGSSKGIGFVLFKDKQSADDALRSLQGYKDGYGTNMQVKYAKDSTEQQRSHPKYQEFLQSKYNPYQATPIPAQYGTVAGYNIIDPYRQQQAGYLEATVGAGYGGGYSTVEYGSSEVTGQKVIRGRGVAARFNPMARPTVAGNIASVSTVDATNPLILFVYNIGPNATENDLYGLFAKYGRINKVNVIEGKGYGFVHMPLPYEANEAVRALNGQYHNGKILQVSIKSNKK